MLITLIVIGFILFVSMWWAISHGDGFTRREKIWNPIILFVAIAIPIVAVGGTTSAFTYLVHKYGVKEAQFVVMGVVVAAGFAAFFFKRRSQLTYGLVELCFGCLSSIRISLSLGTDLHYSSKWAELVGCAYIVARGLSNTS